MGCLTIEAAGPGVTIQDAGRFGLLRYGVTPAGPMDWSAFETANLALGNPRGAAAVEIAAGGLTLAVTVPMSLAFAGGGFAWSRDGEALPSAARLRLRPGETLTARPGGWGAFAYCAVPGGVAVPEVMGSRATHLRSGIGGLAGRGLRGGDRLEPAGDDLDLDDAEILAPWLMASDAPIRVVLGPQNDHFTADAISTFLEAAFALSPAADRMAYKLEGPALRHARDFNIVSDGIALGAVQVAGDGLPMVLMAEHQPTGGYAKIAHVCRADIGRLAQHRPGETSRFSAVDPARARTLLLELEAAVGSGVQFAPLRLVATAASLGANLVDGVTDGFTASKC